MATQRQQQLKDTQVDLIEAKQFQFADSRIPDFQKITGKNYIPFGERNDYPAYLLGLYNKSAKHNAIINGKCVYILGNGISSEDEAAKEFLNKANESQTWDELIKMLCLDIENFGGFYLEVIPKMLGGYNYYHLSYERIRTNEENSIFYYKKDWAKPYENKDSAEYPVFTNGIEQPSVYYYKEYRSGKKPYALPSWVACCNWVESDIEVSKHTLTNAKSGFSASKFINFYNGEPDERKKFSIQNRFENAATGAEGKKILIGFNNDPTKKPTIDDLGTSDLTKEDFNQVDGLITNNIFAAHSVTHPLLFGIQQQGKLGNSQELRIAFDIFKNTYANAKQRNIENIVKYFARVAGVEAEFKIKDIEPIGLEITENILLKIAPKSWLLEKLNIDTNIYNDGSIEGGGGAPVLQQAQTNDVITNLSGRQHQNISRIVRQFAQGKLNQQQAAMMLKNGFGFSDEDVNNYLGIEPVKFSGQSYSEVETALMFMDYAESAENFTLVSSESYNGQDAAVQFHFKTIEELNENEKVIVKEIEDNPKIKDEDLAKILGVDVDKVVALIAGLVAANILVGELKDGILIKRIIRTKLPQIVKPKNTGIMYSYEKRAIADGPSVMATTRPFCKMIVNKGGFYSIESIQKLRVALGYDVFTRAGGFWFHDGSADIQCRHEWKTNIVIRK